MRVVGASLACVVSLVLATLILTDRPGLQTDFFAHSASSEDAPTFTAITRPRLPEPAPARPSLYAPHLASIRWRGTLNAPSPGRYRFRLRTDRDIELIVGEQRFESRRTRVELAAGLHRLEIGLAAGAGEPRLETFWTPPGEVERPLEADVLFAGKPAGARRAIRRQLAPLSPLTRRLAGAALLVAGLLLGGGVLRLAPATGTAIATATRWWSRPGWRETAPLLWGVCLAVPVYLWIARAAGPAFGALWAVTAVALTVGVGALGPGVPWATLAATLFLLASQSHLFHSLGLFRPGYRAMALVTVAVALALMRLARDSPPRHEPHLLAIGALTVAAGRSLPVAGLILLWLLPALLWPAGRVDRRRVARKLGSWLVGGVAAALLLWALGPASPDAATAAAACLDRELSSVTGWVELLWTGPGGWPRSAAGLRLLGALALGAASVAAASGVRIGRRLLHLMPMAYLLLLVIREIVTPGAGLAQELIAIVPATCLLAGALYSSWGLDEGARRGLLSPVAGSVLAAGTLWLAVAGPYLRGRMPAAEFLPARIASLPQGTIERTLVPGLTLLALALAALAWSRPRTRLPLLLAASILWLGPGVDESRHALATRWAEQREGLVLYPWTRFAERLDVGPQTRFVVAPALAPRRGVGMFGSRDCAEAVARAHFDQQALEVRWALKAGGDDDFRFTTRAQTESWRPPKRRRARERGMMDPASGLVLVDRTDR